MVLDPTNKPNSNLLNQVGLPTALLGSFLSLSAFTTKVSAGDPPAVPPTVPSAPHGLTPRPGAAPTAPTTAPATAPSITPRPDTGGSVGVSNRVIPPAKDLNGDYGAKLDSLITTLAKFGSQHAIGLTRQDINNSNFWERQLDFNAQYVSRTLGKDFPKWNMAVVDLDPIMDLNAQAKFIDSRWQRSTGDASITIFRLEVPTSAATTLPTTSPTTAPSATSGSQFAWFVKVNGIADAEHAAKRIQEALIRSNGFDITQIGLDAVRKYNSTVISPPAGSASAVIPFPNVDGKLFGVGLGVSVLAPAPKDCDVVGDYGTWLDESIAAMKSRGGCVFNLSRTHGLSDLGAEELDLFLKSRYPSAPLRAPATAPTSTTAPATSPSTTPTTAPSEVRSAWRVVIVDAEPRQDADKKIIAPNYDEIVARVVSSCSCGEPAGASTLLLFRQEMRIVRDGDGEALTRDFRHPQWKIMIANQSGVVDPVTTERLRRASSQLKSYDSNSDHRNLQTWIRDNFESLIK